MKTAVFGGTFDPVHIGHIHAVIEAKRTLGIDRIILIPAKQSPLKVSSPTEDRHRINMLALAVEDYDFMEIDQWELNQEGISYTYDTALYLKEEYPDDELFFLIGMDQYVNFGKWEHQEELLEMMQFVVLDRSGMGGEAGPPFIQIKQPVVEVSSTDIRGRASNGDIFRHLVGDDVFEYIKEHGLYGS